jgi:hypothetical protein
VDPTFNVLGLTIPDAGPVFLSALVVHVLAGLTALVAGTFAATARKQRGRHPRAGHVYAWAVGVVFVTATILAAIRWREDAHLFAIAVVSFALALAGLWAHRHPRRTWVSWHATAMAGSFIVLLTGFYVDNGPQLPVWRALPHWTYWVIPAAVGAPLTLRARRRYHSAPHVDRDVSRAGGQVALTPGERHDAGPDALDDL